MRIRKLHDLLFANDDILNISLNCTFVVRFGFLIKKKYCNIVLCLSKCERKFNTCI